MSINQLAAADLSPPPEDIIERDGMVVQGLASAIACSAQTDQAVYEAVCKTPANALLIRRLDRLLQAHIALEELKGEANLLAQTRANLIAAQVGFETEQAETIQTEILRGGEVVIPSEFLSTESMEGIAPLISLTKDTEQLQEFAQADELVQRHSTTTLMTSQAILPVFLPWPPPKASTFSVLGPLGPSAKSFKTSSDIILDALGEVGYERITALAVPNGIALSTPLERIEADGTPALLPDRWTTSKQSLAGKRFSMLDYFGALLGNSEGHFRSFLFIIGPDYVSSSGKEATVANVTNWQDLGLRGVPSTTETLQEAPVGPIVTVLIYEFRRSSDANEILAASETRLSVVEHFTRSNIELLK